MKYLGPAGSYDNQKCHAPEPTEAEEAALWAAQDRLEDALDRAWSFQAGSTHVKVANNGPSIVWRGDCCEAIAGIVLTFSADSPDEIDGNLLAQVLSELAHRVGGGA